MSTTPIQRSTTRPRSARRAVVIAALAAVALAACDPLPPPPPGGETSSCNDIRWGSGPKAASPHTLAPITGVRAGRHHCYDRLVIDLRERPAAGWALHYGTVEQPATGDAVPVRGAADLEIVVRAPAYDISGHGVYTPANPSEAVNVSGFQTFRQVAYAGSFEGTTTFGLGVRARLPYRVFATSGPNGTTHLVVDVAHAWT